MLDGVNDTPGQPLLGIEKVGVFGIKLRSVDREYEQELPAPFTLIIAVYAPAFDALKLDTVTVAVVAEKLLGPDQL
jgi:hypothetical protein